MSFEYEVTNESNVWTWFGLGMAAVIIVFITVFMRSLSRRIDKLTEDTPIPNGRSARACIIHLQETGLTLNNRPQIRFQVVVQPTDGEEFSATVTALLAMTEIAQFQPGQFMLVEYDPNDCTKIKMQKTRPSAVTQREAMRLIDESHRTSEQLNQAGTAASAIVTEFSPTNVYVNGPNIFATLRVKVMPAGEQPFDALMSGAFAPEGIHKYVAGKEVAVRYNPSNKAHVAFDLTKTEHEESRG